MEELYVKRVTTICSISKKEKIGRHPDQDEEKHLEEVPISTLVPEEEPTATDKSHLLCQIRFIV